MLGDDILASTQRLPDNYLVFNYSMSRLACLQCLVDVHEKVKYSPALSFAATEAGQNWRNV